jgi:hypothetical protein
MNEDDIDEAVRRYEPGSNRAYLTAVVSALRDWTNGNSDGWAYWSKPYRAANRAMALIESTTWEETMRREQEDATDAEVAAALRPIKAFLTREGVPHGRVLPARQMGLTLR